MTRKTGRMILLILFMALLCGGVIYAGSSLMITNHFETGIVDITLTEYQKNGEKESEWENFPTVLPADQISKIPRVLNNGCDCYIRAKVQFRGIEEIHEDHLVGIGTDWKAADDGYYYYTKVLPHGNTAELFQGLEIPRDLSQNLEGTTFYLDVAVDAIQSRNFKPNYKSASPWGDVEILASKTEGEYEINSLKSSKQQSFQIVYEGKSEKLVSNSEDFFENFPVLMPGDRFSDSINLRNDTKQPAKIYFCSRSRDDCILSEKIRLQIYSGLEGERLLLYDGPLTGQSLEEEFLLGTLYTNESAEFEFQIIVPEELNNQYVLYNSQVTWIFSTESIPYEGAGAIHTADESHAAEIFCVAVISITIFGMIRYKKRKGQKHNI